MKSNNEVGYRCPPKRHQFKPGQSGNPTGRPKGARSLKTELLDELGALVSVVDGSNKVEVSKARAVIMTLLRLAIAGDARAIATVMSSCARMVGGEDDGKIEAEPPEDSQIIEAVAVYHPKRGAVSKGPSTQKGGAQ
jgi:hypothetical protein